MDQRLDNGSCMSGDVHVQFCERLAGKFRWSTHRNVYVRSLRAGERVMQSVTRFLEERLKVKVNVTKSGCAPVDERQFLGYRILRDGRLVISKRSEERIKDKVRNLTQRNRGVSLGKVILEINTALRGWINYFHLTEWTSQVAELDMWIRRKLRCYRLKQRKQGKSIAKFLMQLGVPEHSARALASSGKGWWRLSLSPPVCHGMTNAWFEMQGLINLKQQRARLNV